ncbi:hypothetical protein F4694_004565 [Bacillus niacini]|uniref:Uncharacterized protein n=1 Tax=Neobacillus niacini TaxID=86668 RepID=A0A852TKL4_9BACI|nr:hypothetical protein [Neobacillus niacini]
MDQSSTQCRGFFITLVAEGEIYWRMARNTGGRRETLADSGKHWRMARNTSG